MSGRKASEQKTGRGGDDLHAESSFVSVGLTGMWPIRMDHAPESREESSALTVGKTAAGDQMTDRCCPLVGTRIRRVGSWPEPEGGVVHGRASHQVFERCPQIAVGRFVLVVAEVIDGLPIVLSTVV